MSMDFFKIFDLELETSVGKDCREIVRILATECAGAVWGEDGKPLAMREEYSPRHIIKSIDNLIEVILGAESMYKCPAIDYWEYKPKSWETLKHCVSGIKAEIVRRKESLSEFFREDLILVFKAIPINYCLYPALVSKYEECLIDVIFFADNNILFTSHDRKPGFRKGDIDLFVECLVEDIFGEE
jgi:hypothetical protein